jgi:hypothetical protein
MAFNLQLQPTPKRSPYVEQLLEPTQIQAFSKGSQIQEAILKALGQGFKGYFAGREEREEEARKEGVRDRLRDVIAEIPTRGPSGWVNPDAGWVPPEGVVDVSMVRQGRLIPEAERGDPRYRMSTDLMGRQGRDEPYTPRDIVPFRPDDPKGTVLADPTQLRGKEALFSAIATDPQLQSLVGSDIDPLTQVMMADLLQKAPGQYLTPAQKVTYGYGPGDVVWQAEGQPPTLVKTPAAAVKKGQPKELRVGPALDANGKQIIVDGKDQFNWGIFQDGEIMTDPTGKEMRFVAGEKGGINMAVQVGGETDPWTEEFQKINAREASKSIVSAARMGQDKQTIDEMLSFFDNVDFNTGKVEEFVLPLKQWAIGLGIDVHDADLASKEAFVAKAKQLVLKQVEFMKGALSNKELTFLEEQVAGLGKSPGGNKLILWLARMSMDKMGQFSQFARSWTTEEGMRFGDKGVGAVEWNDMIADWEKTAIYNQDARGYILDLAYADEEKWKDEGVTEDEIATRLENRYSLSLMTKIFVDY